MFKQKTLKESTFKKTMAILYTFGSAIGSYFTWPWGLIFFGPTTGAFIGWSIMSNDTRITREAGTQTIDPLPNHPNHTISVSEEEGQLGLPLHSQLPPPSAPPLSALLYKYPAIKNDLSHNIDLSNISDNIENSVNSNNVRI